MGRVFFQFGHDIWPKNIKTGSTSLLPIHPVQLQFPMRLVQPGFDNHGVKFVGATSPFKLSSLQPTLRGPTIGVRGKVILAFEANGS